MSIRQEELCWFTSLRDLCCYQQSLEVVAVVKEGIEVLWGKSRVQWVNPVLE